ncbi:ATP-dependent RNA helicase HrpA [Desulfococcaceae bacterium HSG9]|nr:ATP-dependent RNA helicase HrpA [Desulfococcaceae bacterium HSG9]
MKPKNRTLSEQYQILDDIQRQLEKELRRLAAQKAEHIRQKTDRVRTLSEPHQILDDIQRQLEKELCRVAVQKDERFRQKADRVRQRLERIQQHRILCEQHITFPENLPITAKKDEIISAISANRVVIISGETGSGKTTQIPKFCMAAGRGVDGLIGCTQPRRIAAITVANRIAEELGQKAGQSVGYKIRFQDRAPKNAFIKIMTDGILLAEAQHDPYLNVYDVIIVDEAHERSLNIDFILGILKTLLSKRKNLKLIITSATIDTQKFSRAFDNAPIIEVSGRAYPVTVRYQPWDDESDADDADTYVETAMRAVEKLQAESRFGDILIFMPTEQAIRETCHLLASRYDESIRVLPLFARLTASEQTRVFASARARKIIVATNIAETSLTIPGIKYVIDTGLARVSRYSPRTRITSLPVVAISQSSADQRKGRCGRVADGVCIRLYEEENYAGRPLYTPPEILRANLAEVSLRMIALLLGEVSDFPFIDRPDSKSIRDGYKLLAELGAIVERKVSRRSKRGHQPIRYKLTANGRLMAKIPIDPRLSRILIQARHEGCVQEITIIAAALSIPDPRERPSDKTQAADQAHKAFEDPLSDFVTLLNIWNRFHTELDKGLSQNKMRRFCKTCFLSYKRMREWRDVHRQLTLALKEHASHPKTAKQAKAKKAKAKRANTNDFTERYAAIHKALLSGLLSNIATKKEKNIFQAAHGREVMIFPGSALFNNAPQWITAAEMVATSRLFARRTAAIDHLWLETVAGKQCKYTYSEPHWERNREEVVAYEQVSLYGLIIIPRRPVSYGPVDPQKAATVFIESALVQGDVKQPLPFMAYNQKNIAAVKDMENRLRRRDLLTDEYELVRFFEKRLGTVYSMRTLKSVIRKQGNDRFLRLEISDLMNYSPEEETLNAFPDRIDLGAQQFECRYNFDPGRSDDGVTVKIPATVAAAVPRESLDWIVPGLQKEKITTMIKGLPKKYRKQLVPAADTAEFIVGELASNPAFANRDTSLPASLSNFVHRRLGVIIPESVWMQTDLPEHLKMRITITDSDNKELHSGRGGTILKKDYAQEIAPDETGLFESAKQHLEKTGLTCWDFGDLKEAVIVKGPRGLRWSGYYGLEPDSACVHLRVFRNKRKALLTHTQGVQKLYMLRFSNQLKYLKRKLKLPHEAKPLADYFGGASEFEKRLYEGLLEQLFAHNFRNKQAFEDHAKTVAPTIHTCGDSLLAQSIAVSEHFRATRMALHRLEQEHCNQTQLIDQLRTDLDKLVPRNFTSLYDTTRLGHIVRYVKAIAIRAQRAAVDFEKDRKKALPLSDFTSGLNDLLEKLTDSSASVSEDKRKAVEEYFWCIEEYKVSLFAQELKTAFPISSKRLKTMLKDIQQMV